MLSTLNVCAPCLRWLKSGVRPRRLVDLRRRPNRVTLVGMNTSTTPRISPTLEPETMTALMLRYIEGQEEAAYQYARALAHRLTADLSAHDALRLARDIVTESTNYIRDFEEEKTANRVDVALRRLIDRIEADEAFMAELTKRAEWGI